MTHIIAVVVDCRDAERLADFWRSALDYLAPRRWRDSAGLEYVELDGTPSLLFQPVSEDRAGKNRLHLDLAPTERDQAEEVERLRGLGATVLADEPGFPWVVLADPEGNEFCVLPRR